MRPTSSSLKPLLLHLGLNTIEIPTLLKPGCIITVSFLTVAIFASTDPGYQRFTALNRLTKRDTCFGYGCSCADACGPGWTQCASERHCYQPSVGHVCCSDGSKCAFHNSRMCQLLITSKDHCEPGYYCTSGGCCPEGEECGYDVLSTLVPAPSSA